MFLGSQGCNFAYNLGSDIGDSWSSGQPQDPGLPHPSPRIERGPSHHYAIIGNFPAEAKTDERDCGRLGSSGMSKVTTVVYVLSSRVCPIPFIISLNDNCIAGRVRLAPEALFLNCFKCSSTNIKFQIVD